MTAQDLRDENPLTRAITAKFPGKSAAELNQIMNDNVINASKGRRSNFHVPSAKTFQQILDGSPMIAIGIKRIGVYLLELDHKEAEILHRNYFRWRRGKGFIGTFKTPVTNDGNLQDISLSYLSDDDLLALLVRAAKEAERRFGQQF